ncbi:hypothetical protein ACHQM5_027608 [Ranunculus cassubicifolius]
MNILKVIRDHKRWSWVINTILSCFIDGKHGEWNENCSCRCPSLFHVIQFIIY